MHEHLAAGLPVVSSEFPAAHGFPDVVWRAESPSDWEQRIGDALQGKGPGTIALRQSVARSNTWDERGRSLEMLLSQLWPERD